MKIVFFGDSVTDCNRVYDDPANLGDGYVKYTTDSLVNTFDDMDFEFFNRGISGNRTCDLLARLDKDVIEHQPDIVTILIGINDTWRKFDMNDPNIKQIQQAGLMKDIELEIGDDVIRAGNDGSMAAKLKVNGFRPYVGLGWGRAIPKHRFGFRFEMGAVFHGHPELVSDNLVSSGSSGDISDAEEIINKITVFPQISLQLTYKLFKDK